MIPIEELKLQKQEKGGEVASLLMIPIEELKRLISNIRLQCLPLLMIPIEELKPRIFGNQIDAAQDF